MFTIDPRARIKAWAVKGLMYGYPICCVREFVERGIRGKEPPDGVLVRLGAEPTIWIGKDRFSFSRYETQFRGTDLSTIKMRVLKDGQKRATYFELPFTVGYGKNWGAWQAFRELESNTRDENGKTWHDTACPDDLIGQDGLTRIVVHHAEFDEAYAKRNEVFLPGASRESTGILEALPGEGSHIYYRGMRAYDLGKGSIFTYNLIEKQELTEDRTLKYEFYAKRAVAEWVVKEASANQIEQVVKADKDAWEFGLEFPAHVPPSDAFKEVMLNRRKPATYVPAEAVVVSMNGSSLTIHAPMCTCLEKRQAESNQRELERVLQQEREKRQRNQIAHAKRLRSLNRRLRRLYAKHQKRISPSIIPMWDSFTTVQQYAILKDIDYRVRHV